jgi:hypothetical protein
MKIYRSGRGLIYVVAVLVVVLIANILYFEGHVITLVSPVYNSLVKVKVLDNIKDYQQLETENFIINYKKDEIEVAKLTGEIAERYYNDICSMFDYYPKEKIQIVVYSSGKEILDNTGLNKNTPPLGVYYGGIIHVLSPNSWIDDRSNLEQVYQINGPIVHEFTHLIVDRITKGNYPIWLTEGIALYAEYKITGFEWGRGIDYNKKVSIEELNSNFYNINQSLAYRKSFEIVRDISENWGFDSIVLILNKLGEGNNFSDCTRAVLKIDIDDLNLRFNE